MYGRCQDLIRQRIYHSSFKFILSERLSTNLCRSEVLLFLEFRNIVSILNHTSIEFILLLYSFLVIYFVQYKKNII